MFILTLSTLIIIIIATLMTLIVNLISKKMFLDREKSSPYECGFDPKSLARIPFSLQFFLIAVIFLIFDIEIALLFPMIMCWQYSNITSLTLLTFFFISFLLMGLFHEWKQGALEWAI